MSFEKQGDEKALDRRRVMADLVVARRDRARQFEPVQGRLAGDRRAIGAAGRQLAGQNRHDRIVSKFVMIVEVLVAEREGEDPPANEDPNAVLD